jgi:hypothetical protein
MVAFSCALSNVAAPDTTRRISACKKVIQSAVPATNWSRSSRDHVDVRRTRDMNVNAIYHLASALCACCMHDLLAIQTVGSPATRRQSER